MSIHVSFAAASEPLVHAVRSLSHGSLRCPSPTRVCVCVCRVCACVVCVHVLGWDEKIKVS